MTNNARVSPSGVVSTQPHDQEPAWVLYEPARTPHRGDSFLKRYGGLLDGCGLETLARRGEEVLIKIDVGEPEAFRALRPVFIRMLVEKIRSLGSDPVLFDTSHMVTEGPGVGWDWIDSATVHGLASQVLGAEIIVGDGWGGGEVELLPVEGDELGGVEVSRAVVDGGPMVVVSHVTGHPLAGISGALLTFGEGCLGGAGKRRLHRGLVPQVLAACDACGKCVPACPQQALSVEADCALVDADRCAGCLFVCIPACPLRAIAVTAEDRRRFDRRVAEAAGAVWMASMGKVLFINFLLDVTAWPETSGFSDLPVVPDLGVLISRSLVALDAATLDLIDAAPGVAGTAAQSAGALAPGAEKLRALSGADPRELLAEAEVYGLGFRDYRLMSL